MIFLSISIITFIMQILTRGTTSIFIKATKTELTNANQCFVSLYQRILLASLASGKLPNIAKQNQTPNPLKAQIACEEKIDFYIPHFFNA